METLTTQYLIERLANLLRNESRNLLSAFGLQPVQLDALRYLARCNRYSDTPMAVADYLGQTKGTVSQSLKVLEKNGLIQKCVDHKDKRVTHMSVTDAGRALLQRHSVSTLLGEETPGLGEQQIVQLNRLLKQLLSAIQAANQFKTFGQCASCSHHRHLADGQYQCGLTQETLRAEEIELVCREHLPRTSETKASQPGDRIAAK